MCLNFGTPKMINFPFGTHGKSIILGVLINKHITETVTAATEDQPSMSEKAFMLKSSTESELVVWGQKFIHSLVTLKNSTEFIHC